MFKNIYRIFILLVVAIMVLASCGKSDQSYIDNKDYNENEFEICELKLSGYAGDAVSANADISFSATGLQKKINSLGEVFIYGNPVEKIEKTVALFGFENEAFDEYEEGKLRNYTDGDNSGRKLQVDTFGCFTYKSGVSVKEKPCTFSDKECMEKGREYLISLGLWPHKQIKDSGKIQVMSNTSRGVTTIVEKGITFYPKDIDGVPFSGTRKITVMFNSDMEITSVTYNWREYESRRPIGVVSIEEAIQSIKRGDCRTEYDDLEFGIAEKISIEDMVLSYYEESRNLDNLTMQPVYILTGKGVDGTNNKATLHITVPAIKK